MEMHIDETLALLRDPYRFISLKSKELKKDVFETRFFLQKTICMTGPEAAEIFYSPHYFTRNRETAGPIKSTLFGKGGVQNLDGVEHTHRKKMFMELMKPEKIESLKVSVESWWDNYLKKWSSKLPETKIYLYDELEEILTGAVCGWAGVPLKNSELALRTKDLAAMFNSAAGHSMKHLWSRTSRKQTENWIEKIIKDKRQNSREAGASTPLELIAWHRNADGELLSQHTAAVELLNLLRPTVAVSVYFVFIAHALHQNPECLKKLKDREPGYNELFIEEIKRFYPFLPSIIARTRLDFNWKDHYFPRGTRVMLDLYGINHDSRTWDSPQEFNPLRFKNFKQGPFNFIPQGGGDPNTTHRCPGEWITNELMMMALDFFVFKMSYNLPVQNLTINWSALPAIPDSRIIINNVVTLEQDESLIPPIPSEEFQNEQFFQ